MADPLEQVIAEAVLVRLASPDFLAALAEARQGDERGDVLRERVDLEARLDELANDYYAARTLGRREYDTARAAISDRLAALQTRLARLGGAGVLTSLPRREEALRVAWAAGSLDWRRHILTAVLEHVTIGPAVRGRNTFDVTASRSPGASMGTKSCARLRSVAAPVM